MNAPQNPLLTIGHSNHSADAFAELLLRHGVEEVFDVRSAPYSRYTPQFNQRALTGLLEGAGSAGIDYTFLGAELGGRPADRSCYDANGRVLYERLASTDLFDDGIRRVVRAADERRVVLMCSEKEPLDCHRALLIAPSLTERGALVEHVLADGDLEGHEAAMDRLLDSLKLPRHGDMFRSRDDVIAEALLRQAQRVAYVGDKPPAEGDWEDAH